MLPCKFSGQADPLGLLFIDIWYFTSCVFLLLLLFYFCRMLKYIDWSNKVSSFTSKSIPSHCKLKLSILLYFRRYMDENLRLEKEILSLPDAGDAKVDSNDDAVFMKKWYRTEEAIIMQLSNGTVQVNIACNVMWNNFGGRWWWSARGAPCTCLGFRSPGKTKCHLHGSTRNVR